LGWHVHACCIDDVRYAALEDDETMEALCVHLSHRDIGHVPLLVWCGLRRHRKGPALITDFQTDPPVSYNNDGRESNPVLPVPTLRSTSLEPDLPLRPLTPGSHAELGRWHSQSLDCSSASLAGVQILVGGRSLSIFPAGNRSPWPTPAYSSV
jgi:hypothetical protein